MAALKQSYTIQIFATDIDSQAIATARVGLYPLSIAADISSERLARFFTLEADSKTYRIHKSIRDMMVFSIQDVIKDPPFSKIDLISCRNLLIYLGGDLQKRLIPLFHYALNPGGFLFLGTSETVSNFGELFIVLDRKVKLYQRKDDCNCIPHTVLERSFPHMVQVDASRPGITGKTAVPVKVPLRELTEQSLLLQVTPAAALVTGIGDILYLHGHTGMFLEPASGVTGSYNILKMAREGLQHKLTIALHKAVSSKEVVRISGMNVKTNGHFTTVNLNIRPVTTGATGPLDVPLYLVVLEEAPLSDLVPHTHPTDSNAHIAALEQELRDKEESLLIANENLEVSNEELKSSIEEMQSVNEELQSTNEELVTSQEELQSVNEELFTVNAELQTAVSDLSRANNDAINLLSGTNIGTIFVDYKLRIISFTPAVTQIIKLVQGDVGRPVEHFAVNLMDYNSLKADINSVLDTLISKEVNVQTAEGKWYRMSIAPYRTSTNAIEGAVITFIDITELRRSHNDLLRMATIVRNASDGILMHDLKGCLLAWNPAAERMYGYSEPEALQMTIYDLLPESLWKKESEQIHQMSQHTVLEPFSTQRIAKNGSIIDVLLTATALLNDEQQVYAIATTERRVE